MKIVHSEETALQYSSTEGTDIMFMVEACKELIGNTLSTDLPLSWNIGALIRLHDSISHCIDEFKVLVVHYGDRVVAVLPFFKVLTDDDTLKAVRSWNLLGEDEFINFCPMILAPHFDAISSFFPEYVSYDWGTSISRYLESDLGVRLPYNLIRPEPLDTYLPKFENKVRKDYERLLRKCNVAGFDVVYDYNMPDGYEALAAEQAEYREEKDVDYISNMRNTWVQKLHSPALGVQQNLIICHTAQQLGLLRTISIYDQGKLIAVNLAVKEKAFGRTYMSDYITVRSQEDKYRPYSLGVICILLNIAYAHKEGCDLYDLGHGGEQVSYKSKFPHFTAYAFAYMKAPKHAVLEIAALENLGGYFLPVLATNISGQDVLIECKEDAIALVAQFTHQDLSDLRAYYYSCELTKDVLDLTIHIDRELETRYEDSSVPNHSPASG